MKKAFRLVGIIGTSVLYCFVVGLYGSYLFNSQSGSSLKNTNGSTYNTVTNVTLLCHTEQTESSFHSSNSSYIPFAQNYFTDFASIVKATQHLCCTSFSQYFFFSKNTILRLVQTDIIFPFHYHW